jgi:integrase/recombinase XerC
MTIISAQARAHQRTLLDEYELDMRALDKADATVDSYLSVLRRANEQLPAGVFYSTTAEIRAWIWVPGRSAGTKKAYRSAFRSVFAWATDPSRPTVDYDPTVGLPKVASKPGHARPAPQDALGDILARAREPFRTWMLIAAAQGLRCVEISRLDREHIDQEQTWVQGKGGCNGYVITHPVVWLAVQDLPAGPVARNPTGGRATRGQVYRRANAHIRTLGYTGLTMHQLRHWHGHAIKRAAGGDITVAQQALRHASIATTRIYVGDDPAALTAAVHALPLPVLFSAAAGDAAEDSLGTRPVGPTPPRRLPPAGSGRAADGLGRR